MNEKIASVKWVTEAVLIGRINDRLSDDSQKLKEDQMEGSPSLGHFYENPDDNSESPGPIDLEAIAREMGVLAPDEAVAHVASRGSDHPKT
jgi:hypothetical protein